MFLRGQFIDEIDVSEWSLLQHRKIINTYHVYNHQILAEMMPFLLLLIFMNMAYVNFTFFDEPQI